jgi:hypothetical protein
MYISQRVYTRYFRTYYSWTWIFINAVQRLSHPVVFDKWKFVAVNWIIGKSTDQDPDSHSALRFRLNALECYWMVENIVTWNEVAEPKLTYFDPAFVYCSGNVYGHKPIDVVENHTARFIL